MTYKCELKAYIAVSESVQRLNIVGNYRAKLEDRNVNKETTFVDRVLYSNTPRSNAELDTGKFVPCLINHVHQNGWRGTYLLPHELRYTVWKVIFIDSTASLLYLLYHRYKTDNRYIMSFDDLVNN